MMNGTMLDEMPRLFDDIPRLYRTGGARKYRVCCICKNKSKAGRGDPTWLIAGSHSNMPYDRNFRVEKWVHRCCILALLK